MMRTKVKGLSELDKELRNLTKAAGKGVMRRTLKQAAQPMVDAANANAPVGETGEYAQSFSYSTRLNKRQGKLHRKAFRNDKQTVEGFVGTNDPAGVQQEFGNVNHGPQPALRPAWDAEKKPTLDRIGKILGDEIEKAIARAKRKAERQARRG